MDIESASKYDFDYYVIGGGSGGMASAKMAASLGFRVGLADFVKPSTQGTTWGLGGTCVNVGCIPKKLMHYASILGEKREEQKVFGFGDQTQEPHSWNAMLEHVNNYIRSLNWGYKSSLVEKSVTYSNALARITAPHTIELTFKNGKKETKTAEHILLAMGGRPVLLDLPGAKECCITSDDIFWREKPPGKCLVIGVGYIGLECGGFLRGMGYPVDLLHRGEILRGFDRQMVRNIHEYMKNVSGVNFIQGQPVGFEKVGERVKATWTDAKGQSHSQEYDTVLMAVGRAPDVRAIGLEALNIKLDKWQKIIVDEHYQTSVPGVYAVGDIVADGRELTPVAIKQGQVLAKGLVMETWSKIDLKSIATTVFTPLEYGCAGWYEEEAVEAFGAQNIEVYEAFHTPIEWSLNAHRKDFKCILKIITRKADNVIIGAHYTGPNAGEFAQGLSASVRLGLTLPVVQDSSPLHGSLGELLQDLQPRTRKEVV